MSNITKSSSSNKFLDSTKVWLNEWWITDWDYRFRGIFTSLIIICVYSQIFRVMGYDLFRFLAAKNKKIEIFYYAILFIVMFSLATKLSTWKPLTTDECAKECATIIPIINQRAMMNGNLPLLKQKLELKSEPIVNNIQQPINNTSYMMDNPSHTLSNSAPVNNIPMTNNTQPMMCSVPIINTMPMMNGMMMNKHMWY
jgi:hypothetical protein